MRKLRSQVYLEPHVHRHHPIRGFLIVLLGTFLLPFVYESALLCAANWRALWGPSTHVETPWLDALGSTWHSVSRVTSMRVTNMFERLPWQPSIVIALGIAWALFMSTPLRKR